MIYDLIIIGSGPAGLTAALYAGRADKSVLVIEKGAFGGQITLSPKVENIPGFTVLSGNEFADKMVEQVLAQGADFESEEVLEIQDNGATKIVRTDFGTHEGKAVILATGARHRTLGLPNEETLIGNGISFCAVCDGAFFKNKVVGVVGGGNSALQEALLLADLAAKVYVIQDLDNLTGEQKLQDLLRAKPNVEIITGTLVAGYLGTSALEGVRIRNQKSGAEEELTLDGLFLAVGMVPQNEAFRNVATLNDYGYVDADESCLTETAGIFVAGDCRSKSIRQVTTAASDGAIAALAACRYLDN